MSRHDREALRRAVILECANALDELPIRAQTRRARQKILSLREREPKQ